MSKKRSKKGKSGNKFKINGKTIYIYSLIRSLKLQLKQNGISVYGKKHKTATKIELVNKFLYYLKRPIIETKNNKVANKILIELYEEGLLENMSKASYDKVVYPESKTNRKKDYNNYINSSQWKTFRSMIIEERGQYCEVCDSEITILKNLHLHHIHYDNFKKELRADVILACKVCHEAIHNKLSRPPYSIERFLAPL